MAYALLVGSTWVEIDGPFAIGEGDDAVHYPANWLASSSDEDLAAIGVLPIVEPGPPAAGLEVTGAVLIDVDGVPTRQITTAPIDLDRLRADAIRAVNDGAGAFRRLFITDITGQQATYLAKEAEARAWAPGADPTYFPYLTQEAAATGQSVADVVALVLATAAQWRALDPRIEGRRRGASVAIAEAADAEAIAAAGVVEWTALLA